MLIRNVRDGDWESCLGIDLSYETDTAWLMDDVQDAGEWHVSFVRFTCSNAAYPACRR